MQNNIDFVYEYSDLRFMHTRVQVLTGDYAGLILEFGGSGIAVVGDNPPVLDFQYTLYAVPNGLTQIEVSFLADLLVAVLTDRKEDPEDKKKADEAAMEINVCKIKIADKFYDSKVTVV